MSEQAAPSRLRVAAAFAAVYLIWGSTYLAIHFAIQTLPPLLMVGARFVIAGGALYIVMRLRGAPRPTRVHWGGAFVVGGLLLLAGNGGVVWAEQTVPTGLTALMIGLVPLWMVLLDWLRPRGVRPSSGVIIGLLVGLAGVVLLIGPGQVLGGSHLDPFGAGVLLVASFSWATGSLLSRAVKLPAVPLLATAMEMLVGGVLALGFGLVTGEGAHLHLAAVSTQSVVALAYLVMFGSLVGFSAYVWLLRVASPASVSTYAYVNPVVAVVLGSVFLGEQITARTLVAAVAIVAAVVIITTYRMRGGAAAPSARKTVTPPRDDQPAFGALREQPMTGGEPALAERA